MPLKSCRDRLLLIDFPSISGEGDCWSLPALVMLRAVPKNPTGRRASPSPSNCACPLANTFRTTIVNLGESGVSTKYAPDTDSKSKRKSNVEPAKFASPSTIPTFVREILR
nr:hypothetical protein [Allocoleopsis franciscana]